MRRTTDNSVFSSGRVRGHELEHAALAVGQRVRLTTRAVVDDACPDQALLRRRQPNEAHFAGHLLALSVAVQPFENGPRTAQCAFDIARMQADRRKTVGLDLRAQRRGPQFQQLLAWQLEELDGIVVDVDENVAVDVEHDDRFGRVFDQRAITRFAFAQRLLVLKPLGHVAHAQHEAHAGPVTGAADRDLDRQRAAAASARLDDLGRSVDEGVRDAIGERIERRPGRHELREETRDVLTDDLLDGRTEEASRRSVGFLHDAVRGDAQDRVFDVVEDRRQDRRRIVPRRCVVAGENQLQVVANRRALQRFGNPALEAVLRHGELRALGAGRGCSRKSRNGAVLAP